MSDPRFLSRDMLGMVKPRSVSYNISPSDGGVAVHYGGGGQGIKSPAEAAARWLGWQRYHMRTRGWVDIAYSIGFDDFGNVYAGRGFGVRTAANGTAWSNGRFLAACWLGGGSEVPSVLAYDSLEWIVEEFRRLGSGRAVASHGFFKPTACAGKLLNEKARSLSHRDVVRTPVVVEPEAPETPPVAPPAVVTPVPAPAPRPRTPRAPARPEPVRWPAVSNWLEVVVRKLPTLRLTRPLSKGRDVQRLQALLVVSGAKLKIDGILGPVSLAALNGFQRSSRLKVDGICGPKTWSKLLGA